MLEFLTAYSPAAIISPEVAGEGTAIAILPWTLLIPIIINAAMFIYTYGALGQRIKTLETNMLKLEMANEHLAEKINSLNVSLAEMKIMLTNMKEMPWCPFHGKNPGRLNSNGDELLKDKMHG